MSSQGFPLKDQIAVVTGGSRGIGRAVSKRLAELGAGVVVNYSRSAGAAEDLINEIKNNGGKAWTYGFDVSDSKAVETAFEQIIKSYGRVDILVNNAGIAIDSLLVRTKAEDWHKTIEVNLSSCFYCSKAVAKSMMKSRAGRIINISSVIGEMGNAGQVAYSASKAGMLGLTKSLARELASRSITVNAITPGYIQTEMTEGMAEEYRKQLLEHIPLNRLGAVEDVVSAVAFFAHPDTGYITGQILGVNGGMYM